MESQGANPIWFSLFLYHTVPFIGHDYSSITPLSSTYYYYHISFMIVILLLLLLLVLSSSYDYLLIMYYYSNYTIPLIFRCDSWWSPVIL